MIHVRINKTKMLIEGVFLSVSSITLVALHIYFTIVEFTRKDQDKGLDSVKQALVVITFCCTKGNIYLVK